MKTILLAAVCGLALCGPASAWVDYNGHWQEGPPIPGFTDPQYGVPPPPYIPSPGGPYPPYPYYAPPPVYYGNPGPAIIGGIIGGLIGGAIGGHHHGRW